MRTVDVAPASAQDFDGLSSFYPVVGRCVGGYLAASILAISSGARPANPKRAVIRLVVMALIAIVGGLGPVRRIRSEDSCGAEAVRVSGAWCVWLQGGGGRRRGASATDDNAADRRAKPRVSGMIRRTGPRRGHLGRPLDRVLQGNDVTGPLLVLSAWAVAGSAVTLLATSFRKKRPTERSSEGDTEAGAEADAGAAAPQLP